MERDWELWVHERTRELFDDWDEVVNTAADMSDVLDSLLNEWPTGTAEEPRKITATTMKNVLNNLNL